MSELEKLRSEHRPEMIRLWLSAKTRHGYLGDAVEALLTGGGAAALAYGIGVLLRQIVGAG